MTKFLVMGSDNCDKKSIHFSTKSSDTIELATGEDLGTKIAAADAVVVAIDLSTKTQAPKAERSPKEQKVSDDDLDIMQVVTPPAYEKMSFTEQHIRKEIDKYIHLIKQHGKPNVPIVLVGTNLNESQAKEIQSILDSIYQQYDIPVVLQRSPNNNLVDAALKEASKNVYANNAVANNDVTLIPGGYVNPSNSTVYLSTEINRLNPLKNTRLHKVKTLLVDILVPFEPKGELLGKSSFMDDNTKPYKLLYDPATEICFRCLDSKDYPGGVNPYHVLQQIYKREIGGHPPTNEEHFRKSDTQHRYLVIEKSRYKKILIDYLLYEDRIGGKEQTNKSAEYSQKSISELQQMVNQRQKYFVEIQNSELIDLSRKCDFAHLSVTDSKFDESGNLLEKTVTIRFENGINPYFVNMAYRNGLDFNAVTPYEISLKLNSDSFNELISILKTNTTQEGIRNSSKEHVTEMNANSIKGKTIAGYLNNSCHIEYIYHRPYIIGAKQQPTLKVTFNLQNIKDDRLMNIILYDKKLSWSFKHSADVFLDKHVHSSHKPKPDEDNILVVEMTQAEFDEIHYQMTRDKRDLSMCAELEDCLEGGSCRIERGPDRPIDELDDTKPLVKIKLSLQFVYNTKEDDDKDIPRDIIRILIGEPGIRSEYKKSLQNYLKYLDSLKTAKPQKPKVLELDLTEAEFQDLHKQMLVLDKSYRKMDFFGAPSPLTTKKTIVNVAANQENMVRQQHIDELRTRILNNNLAEIGIEQITISNEVNADQHDINIYFSNGTPSLLVKLLNEMNIVPKVDTDSSMQLSVTTAQATALINILQPPAQQQQLQERRQQLRQPATEINEYKKYKEAKDNICDHMEEITGGNCYITKLSTDPKLPQPAAANAATLKMSIQYPITASRQPPADLMAIIQKWAALNHIELQTNEPSVGKSVMGKIDTVVTAVQTRSLKSPKKSTAIRSVIIDKNDGTITLQINKADLHHINALCVVDQAELAKSSTKTTFFPSDAPKTAKKATAATAATVATVIPTTQPTGGGGNHKKK